MIAAAELRSVGSTGNIYLDSLTFPVAYLPGTQITYVLQGKPGDGANGGATWAANGARTAFQQALASWSAVANVSFLEAAGPYNGFGSIQAYDWIENFAVLQDDFAAEHDLPFAGTLRGSYNNVDDYYTRSPLLPGSLAYSTFVHEIGHGLGLLHPHNDGDEPPNDPTFPGVEESYDFGLHALNQGIYSVMTYNSGYFEVGYSLFEDFGWEAGPMAFDIAAVQRLYGANATTNAGQTIHLLPGQNAPGTSWLCIWDAGGEDTISAGTSNHAAIIDLRAATLLGEPGGGGFVSRIVGVVGGFTIANNVVIENATGGSGDDRLHGNAASNRLDGGAGYDTVDYSGATADLVIDLAAGTATGEGADTLVSIEAAIGGLGDDRLVAFGGVPGTTGVFDVIKRPPQNIASRSLALDLDYTFADRSGDPTVQAAAGMVTAQVHAQGGNGADFYSFFAATSGSIYIDIDNSFALDTLVRVYDEAGTEIASNDDADDFESLDSGSAIPEDSYLVIENVVAGQRLFVEIVDYFLEDGLGFGTSYDLNISLATSRTAEARRLGSVLDGGEGDDTLVNGQGDDWLYGGNGSDTAVFAGLSSAYTITGTNHEDLTIESAAEGRDRLIDIERFRFSDGRFLWSPVSGLLREETSPVFQPIAPITTAEDTAVEITVIATDEDGDSLSYLPGSSPFGTLTGGGDAGVFTFTPAPDFNGQATFAVHVRDSDARETSATFTVTVTPVPDAPRFSAPAMTIEAPSGETISLPLDAYDPDGQTLTISATSPANGFLTEVPIDQFTYTSTPSYIGSDTFTLTATDPGGATAQQVVTVNVVAPQDFNWIFYASNGFAGEVGGSGAVVGTNGFQDISVMDRPGGMAFDGSFNRGGDIVRLKGNASSWKIVTSGAGSILSDDDTFIFIPIGTAGMAIAFADGVRSLRYDEATLTARIGNQSFGNVQASIAAPADGTALPTGAAAEARAKLYLAASGEVAVGGNFDIVGTNGVEQVELTYGAVSLDGSFNKGGDTLRVDRDDGDFSGRVSGAQFVVESNDAPLLEVSIPVGNEGMDIVFDGPARALVYNPDTLQLLLGSQIIPLTGSVALG